MSGILFLCHRFPFPPNKGDKIRSYHVLKALCQYGDVYLGALIDDPLDWQYVPKLSKQVKDICVVERRRVRKHWLKCLTGVIQGAPITNTLFFSPQLELWIDGLIQRNKISKIYIFSSAMAQYVLKYQNKLPIVTDFVDVDSAKWSQYAKRKWPPSSFIYQLEAKRLNAFENEVSRVSEASLLVSDMEANLFKKTVYHSNSVMSMPNGVDTNYFNPHANYSNPYQGTNKRLVFTGLMDYWPNVDAVTWFAKEIFPKIQAKYPEVEFIICGANPAKSIFKLTRRDIMVTGRVPDIRHYIAHADIIVAPLRIARGIQNKVLEALSMSKPIVASPAAIEGIACDGVKTIWVEDSVEAWVDRIQILLERPPQVIDSHAWVKQNYSWEASLNCLSHLFKQTPLEEVVGL